MKKILSKFVDTRLLKFFFSPIILYHSSFKTIPTEFKIGLHNLTPELIEEQIYYLKKNFNIVSIDEYFKAKNKKGLASITFDDGYKNVIENNKNIFIKFKIPVTIFIVTSSFEKKIFWRDKIRFIINNNLEEKFKNYLTKQGIFIDNLYRDSKRKKYNSISIENSIDKFLIKNNFHLEFNNHQFTSTDQLFDSEYFFYGSHSHNHYVMSSLSYEEQFEEIQKSKKIIQQLNLNKSNLFSIPFGGTNDFDKYTILILKKLNYDGVLLSRNFLNPSNSNFFADRLMPGDNDIIETIKINFFKTILKRKVI